MTTPNLPWIIGIAGKAGAGKSTLAQMFADSAGYSRVRFAQPLKDMLKTLGLDEDQVDGDRKEEPSDLLCGHTPRYAMQTLGTEWGRELIGEDVWCRAGLARARASAPAVIDDARFANEFQAIRSAGGVIVEIRRPGASGTYAPQHASERDVDDLHADYLVLNEGSLSDLRDWADGLLDQLRRRNEAFAA